MMGKRGISLVVLVITIIVMIILAGAVIISLSSSGIIAKANDAVFMQNLSNYKDALALYLGDEYLSNSTDEEEVYLDKYSSPTIQTALGMSNSDADKFAVIAGKLVYVGNNQKEREYCASVGTDSQVMAKYSIVEQTGGWEYTTNADSTITLTKYIGNDTEIVVPTRYRSSASDSYKVVYGIEGQGGFFNRTEELKNSFDDFVVNTTTKSSRITKVTISDGIKFIGNFAFAGLANVTEATVPESVIYLGMNAFALSGIRTLTYNAINCSSEKYFYRGSFEPVFYGCNITSITIGNNVVKLPGAIFAYTGCSTLTIGDNVKLIGRYCFYNNTNLTTLNLGSGVKKIESYATNGCNSLATINYNGNFEEFRENIEIGSSNTGIGNASINYSDNIQMTTTEVNGVNWTYSIKDGKAHNLYTNDADLTGTLVIPTTIGGYAVSSIGKDYKTQVINNATSRANVTAVTIPNGIEHINTKAFSNCTALVGTLTLPNTLKTIGYKAFALVGYTGPLAIPASVEYIGRDAFLGPNYFSSITFATGGNLKEIGKWAFQDCDAATNQLVLPEGLEVLEDGAFNHCTSFSNTSLIIPSTVKRIGDINGYSSHVLYDFGGNCTTYQVATGNQYFTAVDGILYSKNMKRLIAIPYAKVFANNTFTVPEGVVQMEELSFNRNANIRILKLPNSYKILDNLPPANVLNQDNVLAMAIYVFSEINEIQVNANNPYYTVINGCLYSKDGKTLEYVPKSYAGALTVAAGTEYITTGAIFGTYNWRVTSISIPVSVKYINPRTLNTINNLTSITKIVDAANPYYTVNASGIIVEK